MSDLVQVINFANKYSDNILPVTSLLKDSLTVSFVGDGSYTIENNELDYSLNSKSFVFNSGNVDFTTGTTVAFNFGDALKYSSLINQLNIFQFSICPRLLEANVAVPVQLVTFKVNVFYGVTLLDTFEKEFDIQTLEVNKHYTFACKYNIPAASDINFTFEILNGGFGVPEPNYIFEFSGYKVEVDNRFLNVPTPYSLPVNYFKNPYSGFGYYVDSLATPTITIGTSYTQITIDALGANILSHLPLEIRGVSQLWTGSKITPISVGDDYDGRFDFTVTAKTGSPTSIELIIDISGGTAGSNVAFTGWIQAFPTAPYNQSMPLDYFSLSTFLANGGKLYAKTDTGTLTIGRRNIKVSRKSKSF
jgi:hypothetical protein